VTQQHVTNLISHWYTRRSKKASYCNSCLNIFPDMVTWQPLSFVYNYGGRLSHLDYPWSLTPKVHGSHIPSSPWINLLWRSPQKHIILEVQPLSTDAEYTCRLSPSVISSSITWKTFTHHILRGNAHHHASCYFFGPLLIDHQNIIGNYRAHFWGYTSLLTYAISHPYGPTKSGFNMHLHITSTVQPLIFINIMEMPSLNFPFQTKADLVPPRFIMMFLIYVNNHSIPPRFLRSTLTLRLRDFRSWENSYIIASATWYHPSPRP